MPESSFPQVLGVISEKERSDKRWLAALYIGSTFPSYPRPPTPLSLEDAEACMEGSNENILESLGRTLATIIGRDASAVKLIVWKTTRTIGLHSGPLSTNGKFLVLRRHLHNVYESQFRVDFGVRNRNPYRYAVFAQSYEHAFSKLPSEKVMDIYYDEIPLRMSKMLEFLGIDDSGVWDEGGSSLGLLTQSCSWLTDVTKSFENKDNEKRTRLNPGLTGSLDKAWKATSVMRPFLGPIRKHYDMKSINDIRRVAEEFLKNPLPPDPALFAANPG